MTINNNKQRGAVSLFVVIFVALLITVVTVSFVRIMVQDQQQASTTDLSQSAYDSAQAGIEDAKRALIRYQSICDSGGDCAAATQQVNSETCNEAVGGLSDVAVSGNEIKVQTDGSNTLAQAYTCTKINLNTIDYLGTLSANESNFIPLAGIGQFDTIQIQWFNSKDFSSDNNFVVDLQPGSSTSWPLLSQNYWVSNRPSILRAQLIQVGGSFTLGDFDSTVSVGDDTQSNANTLFLYPSGSTGVENSTIDAPKVFVGRDIRRTQTREPLPVTCSGNLSAGGYACTVRLTLPTPIGAGDRTSFLRLSALYNKANYRVTLLNMADPVATSVKFNAVQPEIDSTGRANDLFRRVLTRVELIDVNFPYPEATVVETTGDFCKDFIVTDQEADYRSNCTP